MKLFIQAIQAAYLVCSSLVPYLLIAYQLLIEKQLCMVPQQHMRIQLLIVDQPELLSRGGCYMHHSFIRAPCPG